MDGNFSAHFFYDGFRECQAYAVPFDAARVLGAEERLEDVGKVSLWNADAVVNNTNMRLVDDDLHGLAVGEFQGIVDEVVHGNIQQVFVGVEQEVNITVPEKSTIAEKSVLNLFFIM